MPVLQGIGSPLLQVGDLALDGELSVSRGGERELSERRLASGATVSDHSRRVPRTFEVTGVVSALPQPQNAGRPGASPFDLVPAIPPGVDALIPIDIASRREDFEARLDALLDDGNYAELELISKVVGRVTVVLTRWQSTTSPDDGQSATYQMTFREVLRAGNLSIAFASEFGLAMNGSGGAPLPGGGGASQSTPGTLDVVP